MFSTPLRSCSGFVVAAAFFALMAGAANSQVAEQTPFEARLLAARKNGEMLPVWRAFANTAFYVSAIRQAGVSPNAAADGLALRFPARVNPEDLKPYVFATEYSERLTASEGTEAVKLRGTDLLHALDPRLGLVIDQESGGFVIPAQQIQWLRENFPANR